MILTALTRVAHAVVSTAKIVIALQSEAVIVPTQGDPGDWSPTATQTASR